MAKIIALIGIDGSGKTTQASLLYHALRKRGFKVKVMYAGNTGVRLGHKYSFYLSLPIDIILHRLIGIRNASVVSRCQALLKLEALLLFLNYVILVLPKVLLYRRVCQLLITDRYVYDYVISTIAQKKYSKALSEILLRMTPRPTIMILLDVDPLIAHRRKNGEKAMNELWLLKFLYHRYVACIAGKIINTSGSKASVLKEILMVVEPCV